MLVDFQSLRDFDVNRLGATRDAWTAIGEDFACRTADYENSVMAPVDDGTWTGTAATAARQQVQRSHDKLVATGKYLSGAQQAVSGALIGMTAAKTQLDRGLKLAADHGIAVDATGRTYLAGGAVEWYDPPVLAAMDAQRMLYQARFMAYNTDRDFDPILDQAGKFGPTDQGPWLTDADADLAAAEQMCQQLPDQMAGLSAPGPEVRPDTDSQPYRTEWFNPFRDPLTYDKLFYGGLPYFEHNGWIHAAMLLLHWLGNSGATAIVEPDDMMAAMPTFAAAVNTVFGPGGDGLYETGWVNFSPGNAIESEDWYYALNDFRYRIIGMIMTDDDGIQYRDYTIGVKKPYVFGPDDVVGGVVVGHRKDIYVHGVEAVSQADMQHLHTVGLAQNFIVQGISHHSDRLSTIETGGGAGRPIEV